MKAKRILVGAAALVVIAVAAGVFLLASRIDSIVKGALERHGSELTGTPVSVAEVSISIKEGRGTIRGITVDNPDGFKGRKAFALGEITLRIDLATLMGDPLVIEEIRIEEPAVALEVLGDGRTNFDLLMENVRKAEKGEDESGGEEGPGEGRRFAVRSFIFEEGRVEADTSAVGGEVAVLDLPSLRLVDLGGREGATVKGVGGEILLAFGDAVAREAARSGLQKVIEKQLGGAEGKGKDLLRSLFKR